MHVCTREHVRVHTHAGTHLPACTIQSQWCWFVPKTNKRRTDQLPPNVRGTACGSQYNLENQVVTLIATLREPLWQAFWEPVWELETNTGASAITCRDFGDIWLRLMALADLCSDVADVADICRANRLLIWAGYFELGRLCSASLPYSPNPTPSTPKAQNNLWYQP